MNELYRLQNKDRQIFFEEVSATTGISFPIVEKDYWVVWILERLFALEDLKDHLTFKGGTSLSKVFRLIDRFSEDIDLSIEKEFFGFGSNNLPEKASSRKKLKSILEKLGDVCSAYVQEQLLANLKICIGKKLGTDDSWQLVVDNSDPDAQSLKFEYPSITPQGGYIRPFVKIEMGARSEHWPVSEYKINSYAKEALGEKIAEDEVIVRVLNAERTFWEKATILHRLAHLPENKVLPNRTSRHLYDFFQLLNSPVKDKALSDLNLLERVANHNKIYFASTWASYETARKGTLKLFPSAHILEGLGNDYEMMEAMFYGKPRPDWSLILKTIENFEKEFNN